MFSLYWLDVDRSENRFEFKCSFGSQAVFQLVFFQLHKGLFSIQTLSYTLNDYVCQKAFFLPVFVLRLR